MVRQHPSGFPDQVRARVGSIIEFKVGTDTFTLYTKSNTKNAMGRLKGLAEIPSTIQGFLHKVTPQDEQFLNEGIVNIGDGIFYAEFDVSINENDELSELDETDRWIFTKLKENEKVQGTRVFQVWNVTKRV